VSDKQAVRLRINGVEHEEFVEPRRTLADFLRENVGLTGTHIGCEHGVCGACTVLINGDAVRSCLLFAIQVQGDEITTIEGLSDGIKLHPVQTALWESHGLQCGFCTPGIVLSICALLKDNPNPNDTEIRVALSGNLCRCTGYQNIATSVKRAVKYLNQAGGSQQRGSA